MVEILAIMHVHCQIVLAISHQVETLSNVMSNIQGFNLDLSSKFKNNNPPRSLDDKLFIFKNYWIQLDFIGTSFH